jgi:ABC-2 type transport system ATP-binding protein
VNDNKNRGDRIGRYYDRGAPHAQARRRGSAATRTLAFGPHRRQDAWMLALRGLRKTYGSFTALHGLDLSIAAGEILALLGPNGAGKSTTVKCLVGLLRPDAGRIEVDGIDALADPIAAKRKIGYLPEVARLHEVLTPWEFLLLKGRLFDLPDAEIRARGERMLAGFGLDGRGDEPMVGFSKGMVQKVSIAAALLTKPKLLVFDEPLSGLDVTTTLVVKQLMHEFAAQGGAVLHCSHMLDVVETTAHRIAVLDRGTLLACGTAAELRRQVGAGAGEHLDSVFRTLVKASDPVAAAKAILG